MARSADEILNDVAENACREMERALSLPPDIYHNAELLAREHERLFFKGWICAGRAAEVPKAGDYIVCDIIDQPVFVIRQKDGGIKAFPNVCLHRCSRLLDGSGHVSTVSCPYHSWTYDIAGQLIGAPYMQKTADFSKREYKLRELRCETWEGFVYVSLDANAEPVAEQLQLLQREIQDYQFADYVPVYEEYETWDSNWKCLVENFMDVYHVHRVHADSFNKYASSEDVTEMFPGGDAFSYMFVQEDAGPHSVAAHPDNTWLKGDMRYRTYVINVFPSHLIQLQPDLLWYLSVMPVGLGKIRIRWAVSIPKEILDAAPDRDAYIKEEIDFLKQVNREDRSAVEKVFSATRSKHATRGPLSFLERNCWDFGRYLARELVD